MCRVAKPAIVKQKQPTLKDIEPCSTRHNTTIYFQEVLCEFGHFSAGLTDPYRLVATFPKTSRKKSFLASQDRLSAFSLYAFPLDLSVPPVA